MSTRSARMLRSAPDYYEYSKVFTGIQQALADEFDRVAANNDDLRKQLYILTATWGLKYWEEALGIVTVLTDSYDIRRSRVLSQWRGVGNFSASLVKSVCEAYSNGEVSVAFNAATSTVEITFIGSRGIPPNMADLQAIVENIIHAHLGTEYKFTYLNWGELDAAGVTWTDMDDALFTWDELELWNPSTQPIVMGSMGLTGSVQ